MTSWVKAEAWRCNSEGGGTVAGVDEEIVAARSEAAGRALGGSVEGSEVPGIEYIPEGGANETPCVPETLDDPLTAGPADDVATPLVASAIWVSGAWSVEGFMVTNEVADASKAFALLT